MIKAKFEDGKLLIPQNIIQKAGLKDGDEVEVGLENGKVIIKPLIAIAEFKRELKGCVESSKIKQGWNESFDKLAEYLETDKSIISGKNVPQFELPSDRQVVITRIFDAPRELVFRASTDPDLIPLWWGPKRFATTVERMEVRPGGVWRFIQHDVDGNKYAFNGVYREIVPPEREVHTFEFVGMPGHVIIETSVFEEFEGKTKLTVTDLFQSVEDRDGMFNSGMKEGATESMDRLEEIVLKTLKMQQ